MITFESMRIKYPEVAEEIQKVEDHINALPLADQIKALEQLGVALKEKLLEIQEAIDLGNEEYDESQEDIDIFDQEPDISEPDIFNEDPFTFDTEDPADREENNGNF
jgi:chromosome segregation ATPase